MLKLNSKKFAKNMRSYLLDCFENEENTELLTPDQKFIYIHHRFQSEYLHAYNIEKYKNNHIKILGEWLSGLAISCDFYNYDIIKVAKELHELDPEYQFPEKLEDKICNAWFELLAIHIDLNYSIAWNKKEQENEKKLLLKEYWTKEIDNELLKWNNRLI